jgi:hypothetical protein
MPKWLANINLEMDDDNNINADTTETDGTPNLKLDVPLPALKTCNDPIPLLDKTIRPKRHYRRPPGRLAAELYSKGRAVTRLSHRNLR